MKIGIRLVMLVAAVAACAVVAGCGGGSVSPAGESTASTEPTKQSGLIAYTHQASGIDRIYVVRPDGKGRRELTTHDSLDGVWSPDGTKLAYLDHVQNLVVMNADGTGARIVSHEQGIGMDEIASWSPDGKQLVFGAKLNVGPDELYIVNADGTGKHKLGASGFGPDWSPDGKRILFATPQGWVATVGVDGRGFRMVTASSSNLDPPRWSPDGSRLPSPNRATVPPAVSPAGPRSR